MKNGVSFVRDLVYSINQGYNYYEVKWNNQPIEIYVMKMFWNKNIMLHIYTLIHYRKIYFVFENRVEFSQLRFNHI